MEIARGERTKEDYILHSPVASITQYGDSLSILTSQQHRQSFGMITTGRRKSGFAATARLHTAMRGFVGRKSLFMIEYMVLCAPPYTMFRPSYPSRDLETESIHRPRTCTSYLCHVTEASPRATSSTSHATLVGTDERTSFHPDGSPAEAHLQLASGPTQMCGYCRL